MHTDDIDKTSRQNGAHSCIVVVPETHCNRPYRSHTNPPSIPLNSDSYLCTADPRSQAPPATPLLMHNNRHCEDRFPNLGGRK
eukprot:483696-Rhodomonas_salina.2